MDLATKLAHFTGTEHYHRFEPFNVLLYTDGIKFLIDHVPGGAHWLVTAIASYQMYGLDKKCHGFQVWKLKSNGKGGVILTCQADSNRPVLVSQEFDRTNFPIADFGNEFVMYVEGFGNPPPRGKPFEGEGRVLLLQSEH